jgi:hypothetical protein
MFEPTAGTSALSVSVDNSARFVLAGPRVCDDSRLKDGRSDAALSDTDDSREGGLANEGLDLEAWSTLEVGWEGRSNAFARDEVEDELGGRLTVKWFWLVTGARELTIARDGAFGGLALAAFMLPRPFLGTK